MQFAGPGYEFIQVFRVRSGVSPHPRKPDGKCRSKRVLNDHQCHKVIAFFEFLSPQSRDIHGASHWSELGHRASDWPRDVTRCPSSRLSNCWIYCCITRNRRTIFLRKILRNDHPVHIYPRSHTINSGAQHKSYSIQSTGRYYLRGYLLVSNFPFNDTELEGRPLVKSCHVR